MSNGARVIRASTARTAKDARRRHKRPCRSAPATPTNLTQTFHRREIGKRERWRMACKFDGVTLDVAGRPLTVEAYQVQMRATDASGDPVETNLQSEAQAFTGADMTVNAGTAPATNLYRELNASPDEIKKTLTGLTVGIAVQVNFYARKDVGGSAPRIKCQIWNVTDSTETTSKNQVIDTLSPKLHMTLSFTPVTGKTYEARVSWVSGTGIAQFHHVNYHDKGDTAVWRRVIPADELSDGPAVFPSLPRPKTWYFQFRVRALNRVHGGRCWSAWSGWTTPTNPVTGSETGPPAPTGVTLTFDKVEGSRRRPWRARSLWNETPYWFPNDDDGQEGAARYTVQLAVSNDGGSTTANTRTITRPANDDDGDTTARVTWQNVRRVRHYRTRVKAIAEDGRRGAYSAWTSWASPAASFTSTVQNLTVTNPNAATYRAKWDEPADPSDVDRYKVVWRRKNADTTFTIMDTSYTTGTRSTYHVPIADRGRPHRCKVTPVLEELHTDTDSSSGSYQAEAIATEMDTSDVDNTAVMTGSFANTPDGTGTRWETLITSAAQLVGYVSTMDNAALVTVADNEFSVTGPFDTGQVSGQLFLISAASGSSHIDLIADDIKIDAADTRLINNEMRGFCSVRVYNDNASARNFGHGVMYGGVARANNVPSSITFTTAGTDLNTSSPTATDITLRGFLFEVSVSANSAGRMSRSFVTTGN